MSRYVYAFLLMVNSAILSFLIATVRGVYILSGEAAEGAGLYWAFSLPAIIVAAVALGFLSFPLYRTRESLGAQILIHLVSAAAAIAVGHAATLLGFEVYVAIAA